jgi:hypothetical protein
LPKLKVPPIRDRSSVRPDNYGVSPEINRLFPARFFNRQALPALLLPTLEAGFLQSSCLNRLCRSIQAIVRLFSSAFASKKGTVKTEIPL